MMVCKKCNYDLINNPKFCGCCGERVPKSEENDIFLKAWSIVKKYSIIIYKKLKDYTISTFKYCKKQGIKMIRLIKDKIVNKK